MDLIQEVADHSGAMLGVVDFGVILHAVESSCFVGNGHIGAGIGAAHQAEAFRYLCHIVAMAHPGNALFGNSLEEFAGSIKEGLGLAVFTGRILLGLGDQAAQGVGHQLAAVANAQNRDAQFKNGRIHMGRGLQIHGVGAAGEDDAHGIKGLDLLHGHFIGFDLAVDIAFPNAAGDELIVLSAKVQDEDFLRHKLASCYQKYFFHFIKKIRLLQP